MRKNLFLVSCIFLFSSAIVFANDSSENNGNLILKNIPIIPETIAESNYNGFFSVAIQKNNFYGVQFHPEKSSKPGIKILENFLTI